VLCPNCFLQSFNGVKCAACGYEMKDGPSIEDLKLYYRLQKRYIVGRAIGAGGFAITYVAYDTVTDRKVCIKEYFPMGLAVRSANGISVQTTRQNRVEEFENGISHFIEEAHIISQMNNIAGVVSVTDCFEENGTAYYVMEYLDGVPLRQLVPEHGMELRAASGIILQAGRTLNLVHREKGYLHRDVSPENIMVLLSGRVVIIDFGSARNFFMSNSNYTITLKHGFAPIEQYSSADIQGPFTDVYGLASTYYYVLTGKVLPRATDRLTGVAYEPLSVLRPDVGEEISEIVDKALMLQPSERTQTVGEFVSALESVVSRRSCEEGFVYVSVSIDGAVQERYKIEEDKEILVGRSPKCDVVFPGCENVSKVHCKLMFDREKKQFCLEDCSTNGTYINYVKMDKDTKYYVGSQDLIILANTRYRLILGE